MSRTRQVSTLPIAPVGGASGVDLCRDVSAADVRRDEDRRECLHRRGGSVRTDRTWRFRGCIAHARGLGATRFREPRTEQVATTRDCGRRLDGLHNRRRNTAVHPVRDGGSYILRAIARDASGRRRAPIFLLRARSGRVVLAQRWQPDRSDAGTRDVEAWRDGANPDPLAVGPRATALVTTEREGIRSHRSVHGHLDAARYRRADHRSRRAERLRLGVARQRAEPPVA